MGRNRGSRPSQNAKRMGHPRGLKSTWFMCHRLRYSMVQNGLGEKLRGAVEVDEAYIGPKSNNRSRGQSYVDWKVPVVSMLERGTGRVRSVAVERVTLKTLQPILKENISNAARIHTDDHPIYQFVAPRFAGHDVVTHSIKEYARRENGRLITTNTVEGFFSLVKRGVCGTYHPIGRADLQQYITLAK